MPHKSLLKGVVLVVLLAAVFAGLTWSNDQFASANPGGNDFYPRYLGHQWRTRAVPAILIHYLVLTTGLWLLFYLTLIGSNYQNPFMVLVFPAYMVFMLLTERKWAVSSQSSV